MKIILKEDFNPSRTDLILKLMILSATFELMFSHKTPINVIVSEYIKISDFFKWPFSTSKAILAEQPVPVGDRSSLPGFMTTVFLPTMRFSYPYKLEE